jgi:four helix bundle suffix protein
LDCFAGHFGENFLMGFIPAHGGYRKLLSYQKAVLIYDGTVCFCRRFLNVKDRTVDQMVQAARSGKQNIVEGCEVSGASKEAELKLVGVARGSLEELLEDYRDFLRVRKMAVWEKDSKEALFVRRLGSRDGADGKFGEFFETREAEVVANIMICLVNQATYLLNRQIRGLEEAFVKNGGLRERMTSARLAERGKR